MPPVVDAPLVYMSIGESSILCKFFLVWLQRRALLVNWSSRRKVKRDTVSAMAPCWAFREEIAFHLSQLFPLSTLLSLQLASTGKCEANTTAVIDKEIDMVDELEDMFILSGEKGNPCSYVVTTAPISVANESLYLKKTLRRFWKLLLNFEVIHCCSLWSFSL
ncbi:hypothetical protein A4A49_32342 [Nicotiana attenuata]|uniref:Uncharacterized protein n=1 Tax=Nicotiana attenuata TaxID=49451 RepID=A0A1J6K2L5_NICAT|nr:hypothetical protein A4A49_32342 [Nicotiana attenuata]